MSRNWTSCLASQDPVAKTLPCVKIRVITRGSRCALSEVDRWQMVFFTMMSSIISQKFKKDLMRNHSKSFGFFLEPFLRRGIKAYAYWCHCI